MSDEPQVLDSYCDSKISNDSSVDLRKIAEQAGISMDLWDMGAASLAYSEGCHGITRRDLEKFAALYGFACWNAALAANPPNMQGMVSRAIGSLLDGAQEPAAEADTKDAMRYQALRGTLGVNAFTYAPRITDPSNEWLTYTPDGLDKVCDEMAAALAAKKPASHT